MGFCKSNMGILWGMCKIHASQGLKIVSRCESSSESHRTLRKAAHVAKISYPEKSMWDGVKFVESALYFPIKTSVYIGFPSWPSLTGRRKIRSSLATSLAETIGDLYTTCMHLGYVYVYIYTHTYMYNPQYIYILDLCIYHSFLLYAYVCIYV